MGVRTAVQVLSTPVTAALRYMKDQAGHTCDLKFANVGPTVEFMSNMYRWFVLMDVSNCQQHIHQNNPDTKEFADPEDGRLHWLELIFLEYVENLKEASSQENFLSKETYHALVFTTVSNVQCIRFLLNECNFQFVLTRKFSSDPIESFFGFLRRTAGCNDIMDVRSALCGVEKMLKTGIVAASQKSNVSSSASFCSSRGVTVAQVDGSTATLSVNVKLAQQALRELCMSTRSFLPTPDMAAIALVAGYISRVVSEKTVCDNCVSLVQKPKGDFGMDGLIAHQDRGGLFYPTKQLIRVLHALKRYVDIMLSDRKSLRKPLEECMKHSVTVVTNLPVLLCDQCDDSHRRSFVELICKKFMKPLLSNHALDITDRNAVAKFYQRKPLSRKVLKL
uniref:Transposable element n=1 Tax=Rhipicephalus pulchellus TaxID=72859 RepID=L7LXG9_RHIPC